MLGAKQEAQDALFYDFSIEDHVSNDHVLRAIDGVIDLSCVRQHLSEFYSTTGSPSVDPELMMRMLLVGYIMGIRSERRLCDEVHLNLAYRWFCKLDLTDPIPDHSTFSKNRHGRFRDSGMLRHVFETVVAQCINAGLASGQRYAADASIIAADANRQNSTPKADWNPEVINPDDAPRSIRLAEVGAVKIMIDRVKKVPDLMRERVIADTAYGFPGPKWPFVLVCDVALQYF